MKMPRTASKEARNWCFTLNNPSEDVIQNIPSILSKEENIRYACGQLEMGESGTRHIQGYIEFKRSYRLQSLRKLLAGAHFEARRGTREQARDYCRKKETAFEGTQWEIGNWDTSQGKRNDIAAIQQHLKSGGTVRDAHELWPATAARLSKWINEYKLLITEPRKWKTNVLVYVGPTGCGKTQRAHELYPDIWTKPPGPWFDTYDGQANVLMDDFDGKDISFRFLLQLLDRYPCLVPVKGGFKQWVPKTIIITTNLVPNRWYQGEEYAPLERRFDEVRTWNI
ncbi:Rep [uncultured virus]|uniref:ATP-dependent helicase Rep n=1 Tax=uncultured virus TaxID=340016 RepID=A0A2K9LSJ4_9VIRU|nr:Rep [uncultured virus]